MKKKKKSKLCLCSNESEANTLMLNLPHFLSWHCFGVIDLEIYRKRLFEFSTLAWGQKGIILIHRLFFASFPFVNILYSILAKVSLCFVIISSRFFLDFIALHESFLKKFQWSTAHNISTVPQLISMNIWCIRNRSTNDKTNLPPNLHISLDTLLCAWLYLQYSQRSTGHYNESGYLPDTCGRANSIRIRYVRTRIFLNPQQKIFGFEDIPIRVDGALFNPYEIQFNPILFWSFLTPLNFYYVCIFGVGVAQLANLAKYIDTRIKLLLLSKYIHSIQSSNSSNSIHVYEFNAYTFIQSNTHILSIQYSYCFNPTLAHFLFNPMPKSIQSSWGECSHSLAFSKALWSCRHLGCGKNKNKCGKKCLTRGCINSLTRPEHCRMLIVSKLTETTYT